MVLEIDEPRSRYANSAARTNCLVARYAKSSITSYDQNMKNCIIILVLACHVSAAYGQQPDSRELEALLFSKAPNALADYENQFALVQGTVHVARTNRNNWQESTVRLTRNNSCTLHEVVEFRCEKGSRFERFPLTMTVENPRYAFLLERPQTGGPWGLKRVARPGTGEELRVRFSGTHDHVNPSFLIGHRLRDVLRDPGFKLQSIVTDTAGNCRCEFQIDATATQLPAATRIINGTVILDPRHMWRLVSGDLNMYLAEGQPGRATCNFEYEDAASRDAGFAVPSKSQRNVYANNELIDSITAIPELTIADSLPPDSEFMLTAFGFPEPDWDEQQTTSWTMGLVIAGVGLALVIAGVFIVRRYRRAH